MGRERAERAAAFVADPLHRNAGDKKGCQVSWRVVPCTTSGSSRFRSCEWCGLETVVWLAVAGERLVGLAWGEMAVVVSDGFVGLGRFASFVGSARSVGPTAHRHRTFEAFQKRPFRPVASNDRYRCVLRTATFWLAAA
jgi:hypothetical protein